MIIVLLLFIITGGLFSYLGVPAGWLVGALLTGVLIKFTVKKNVQLGNTFFRIAQTLVGINIGLIMSPNLFGSLFHFMYPLMISLILILLNGYLFGIFLYRFTNLDPVTSLFSCIPGGASEIIPLSSQYGADERIVAAFHSTRIIFIVLMVPIVIWLFLDITVPRQALFQWPELTIFEYIIILFLILLTVTLSSKYHLPFGALLFSILIGFVFNQLIIHIDNHPGLMAGIGQAWLGGVIGLRYDRETIMRLKEIGFMSLITIFLFFMVSLGIAYLFFIMTPLDYLTSFLSTIPAGASEMASTAFFLGIDASLVASLQMTRLIITLAVMPKFTAYVTRKLNKTKKLE